MVLRKRLPPCATAFHEFDEESGQRQLVYHRSVGACCGILALFCTWWMVVWISGGTYQDRACCDLVTRDIYRFIGSSDSGYVDTPVQQCVCDDQIDTRVMGMLFNRMAHAHEELASQCVTAPEFGIPVCAASYQHHDHSNTMSLEIMSPVIEATSSDTYAITEEYNGHDGDKKITIVQRKQRPYSATVSYDTMDGRVESKHVIGALCHCIVFLHDLCENVTHEFG